MNLKHQFLNKNLHVPGESKKYKHLVSHNTTSTTSILKIRLGLDK